MRSNPYAGLEIDTIDDTRAMTEAKENANHRKTGRAELALLVLGIALLVVWGAARAEGIINQHAAVRKFNIFDSPASVGRRDRCGALALYLRPS
jgi:hypothetical protein